MTKYHSPGGWNNRKMCFLKILEARSPRSRCQQGWFLLISLSLIYRCLYSPCLHMVFPLCLCQSLLRTPVTLVRAHWLWPHFTLVTSIEALSPLESHSEVLGARASTQELNEICINWGTQPITMKKKINLGKMLILGPWTVWGWHALLWEILLKHYFQAFKERYVYKRKEG